MIPRSAAFTPLQCPELAEALPFPKRREATRLSGVNAALRLLLLSLTVALSGCATMPKLPAIDTSAPGWKVRQGQALWRSKSNAPEIAGEIVLATNSNGGAFVQFLKNPIPLVTAQVTPKQWQIEFVPEKRNFSGPGKPPKQLLWLHLLGGLQSITPPPPLEFAKTADGGTRIENKRTGERIILFLNEE
jgi:hypothetical protein